MKQYIMELTRSGFHSLGRDGQDVGLPLQAISCCTTLGKNKEYLQLQTRGRW